MDPYLPGPIRELIRTVGGPVALPARWAWVFYRELRRDRAFVRAAGMAYASLIALVPMLVLAYGVLGAVGATDDVEVALAALLDGVFGEIPGVRDVILPGLQRVDLRALGAISVGGLLFVAARLYLMVEQAYCDMFGVQVTRKLGFRLLNFYFTMTAVPVVLVLLTRGTFAVAGTGSFVRELLGSALQYGLLVVALKLFPALYVRWGPALLGAGVSWTLLELGRRGFGLYVRLFASDDPLQVVYGSLGLIPLFLLWLYLVWVFVLLGVEVANVAQNYTSLYEAELELLESERPRLPTVDGALQVALAVSRAYGRGEGPSSVPRIVEETGLDGRIVARIGEVLVDGGIFVKSDDGWLPARPPDRVRLAEVVEVWREEVVHRLPGDPVHEVIDEALALNGTLASGPVQHDGPRLVDVE